MMRRLLGLLMGGALLFGPAPAAAHPHPRAGSAAAPGAADPMTEKPERVLSVGLGLGLVSVDDVEVEATGSGAYGEVEYHFARDSWATPILYGGMLVASPDRQDCTPGLSPCDVSAYFGFAGGKVRLMAPIPYVAPFVELGLGVSAGQLRTRVGEIDEEAQLTYHVPFTLGLALGPQHGFALALKYLVHPDQRQFSGALALSLAFGL